MLTYELKKSPGVPLYEALYRCIRGDILSGKLAPGEKLPSKRALAQNLEVSKITVEGAYSQLLAEGYIRAREKVGYFVESLPGLQMAPHPAPAARPAEDPLPVDLTGSYPEQFPFSVWSRLQREILLDYGEKLLLPLPNQGIAGLRCAIAGHLADFRGMAVDPENILIGAGTDFLYNLLIQLLGRDKIYAVEDPGYGKIRKIYAAGGVRCVSAPMDRRGVRPECLGDARVLHISPSHHFPTGLVTPVSRRQALLQWAADVGGYIIEDDYDSEFRFDAHPMSAMFSLDQGGRVIYMNTFSKTLAPSIRISYMILPPKLMQRFREKLSFYSCTVSSFEQYTLARFLDSGHFEKHINRMRKFYRQRRNRVMAALAACPLADALTIHEEDAGLHFLLKVDTDRSDGELTALFARAGIRIQALSSFYAGTVPENDRRCLVVNYAALKEEALEEALKQLPLPFAEGADIMEEK
ncbi:MAG: PLP-dependent aminotransferase family protein [Oscillospiraceae bacterium]|nr:PLP-dependent aminotransferase family protein [Oscillospiraceae bacterium]